jgi:hypothetical protein
VEKEGRWGRKVEREGRWGRKEGRKEGTNAGVVCDAAATTVFPPPLLQAPSS